ncbi:MAG: hypothetical protein JW768_12265 [Chitinispirillaceae bacterium]|nr:hypothetical protein [Chitinispirillaceae bacterium]
MLKLLWLVLVVLIIHGLFRMVRSVSRNDARGNKEPSGAKRFDARGEDIEDGEFRELQ